MSKKVRIKPGKTQSMMGVIAGILFCLIGVFAVIPSAGLFGVFWTLMALVITVTNGINAFTDKGVASHEIVIDDDKHDVNKEGSAGTDIASNTDAAGMEELKENMELRFKAAEDLYKEGVITREEYEAKRREILKDL